MNTSTHSSMRTNTPLPAAENTSGLRGPGYRATMRRKKTWAERSQGTSLGACRASMLGRAGANPGAEVGCEARSPSRTSGWAR